MREIHELQENVTVYQNMPMSPWFFTTLCRGRKGPSHSHKVKEEEMKLRGGVIVWVVMASWGHHGNKPLCMPVRDFLYEAN